MKHYGTYEIKGNFIEGIDEEFKDLAVGLSKIDFSKESNKDFIFNTTIKKISNKRNNNVNKIKKTGIAVASLLIISTILAQTTFAKEVVDNIIKTISLGHFSAIQYNDSKEEEYILPNSLKGKIFDKNGNVLEKITKDIDGIYTKDGEKIATWNAADGSVTTEKQAKEEKEKAKENTLTVIDSSKVNGYTHFEVKLPSYLPDGYKFEKAEFYKDSDEYATLYFKNKETGKEIYMQQRFACEDTKATLATDGDIENIKINGVDAILEDEHNIDWEVNNVVYFLNSGKDLSKDETIKIAESIK
ncbi:hypothetical protein CDLVIII_5108 [Clostridium sp. DL-VIII]|uniref:DUF4367 domain-containing protein n=1 Tax=Clostridium sp. DL-VIII TaxID=641107 RepID=UPI00023B0768|nr:DUF4367 domain-containing protein [Clostridium sp. DL-VIII]EHJ01599.1 hypothetical protein CDLVIII_5108 [Clostridium sp. DL-VIII]